MDQYQQLDLQALIDLLAEETEKYTRAFISGKVEDTAHHKAVIDALIVEIKSRKQDADLPANIGLTIPQKHNSGSSL